MDFYGLVEEWSDESFVVSSGKLCRTEYYDKITTKPKRRSSNRKRADKL